MNQHEKIPQPDANDLYAVLGVTRDAKPGDLHKAYRQRAKTAHPDAGGDPDAWEALNRAYTVLTDPELRARFDEFGLVGETSMETNDHAAAIQIIEAFFTARIEGFLSKTRTPPGRDIAGPNDPRAYNIIAEFIAHTEGEISKMEASRGNGRVVVDFLEDVKGRFSFSGNGENFVERLMLQRLGRIAQVAVNVEAAIRVHRLAINIANSYSYRFENTPDLFRGSNAQEASLREGERSLRGVHRRRRCS
jgi:curved DNA-binding protein CbpA